MAAASGGHMRLAAGLSLFSNARPAAGARALTLAGRVLDPNTIDGIDAELGRGLLREALVAAARALAGSPGLTSLDEAASALERHEDALRSVGGAAKLRALVALLSGVATPHYEQLIDAELSVAKVVEIAGGGRRLVRAAQRRRWAVAVLGLAIVTAIVVARMPRGRWERYEWRASSGAFDYPTSGTLATEKPLLFHTAEEPNPWVIIDMHASRSVSTIIIKNRDDCCFERGLPLVVEVGDDPAHLTEVARRNSVFDSWEITFSRRRARYVRLRSESTTLLHMREIRIP